MRFVGTIEAKVDQKGRVFLPAIFRRLLSGEGGDRLLLRKDVFEPCLVIYPEKIWFDKLDELHGRLNDWNKKERNLFRQFITDAEWLALDGNGRFLIPKRYLKMVGISQNVTFIGMDTTIEIWSSDKLLSFEENAEDFSDELGQIMQ